MCNPAAVQAAVVIVGAVVQGRAAEQQGEFQEGVSRFNARQQENEATAIRNQAVEEELLQRRQTSEFLSAQRAQLAAQGVDIGSGSALQLQEDTVTLGEVDALRIRSNFGQRAEALETQAGLTLVEGAAAEQAGDAALTESLIGAAGTVAGSPVASKWFGASSAGAGNTAVRTAGARTAPLSGISQFR